MSMLPTRDVSLFVKMMGQGYPVVLMHGGPGLDHTTLSSLEPLADQFTLIFYDHRANDRSTGAARPGEPAGGARPLRGFLVRKESKDHGIMRVIENGIRRSARVVIFEGVVTTGGSTLEVIHRAEEAGPEVAAVLSLVNREQGGVEAPARDRYQPLFRKSVFGL